MLENISRLLRKTSELSFIKLQKAAQSLKFVQLV